ncbi:predicted protein [Nematostella vectensis]|uniref:Hormone-sensitive lipase N-terminal domain-containing protein n=1 Tax=Nematostella vectensis TaxID=45351 RepID=A7T0B8_NEMVE|nr:predicted protein [Nematostella vectensis]|eukprot:XP_001622695.1 hypothetical protein NEMVEDRAFT_v1g220361 [Nematostella vectensis]
MASDPGNQTVCVCPPGEREDFDSFPVLLLHLKRIVADNAEYFSKYAHKAVYKRFHESFKQILDSIGSMEELSTYLAQRVTLFDFSPEIKGNGYRSLLRITEHGIRVDNEDKTEASKPNGNNNSRGDIGDDLSNEGIDIESTCSFPQRPGHLNLNINDRSDHYEVTPHDSGHIGVQYRRGSDDCIVVNVVESPTGEDIVEPYLRIGTPPDEEDEDGDTLSPQNEGVTLRRGTKTPRPRSMSQVPLPIAKNPYMSPLLAPDNMLRTLPPVDLVVSFREATWFLPFPTVWDTCG